MRNVVFAAAQFAFSWDKRANVVKAKDMVRAAAAKGAEARGLGLLVIQLVGHQCPARHHDEARRDHSG